LGVVLQFKEAFTSQGIDGGKKAAYALRAAILEQCGTHAGEIEVIANVYANLAGLCKAMRRDGSLAHESDLKDFSLGFTQAKASFDFVDVGHGKERADNKIKGTWHSSQTLLRSVLMTDPPPQKPQNGTSATAIANRLFWASLMTPGTPRFLTSCSKTTLFGSVSPSLKASRRSTSLWLREFTS
jgi:hypothetical protein